MTAHGIFNRNYELHCLQYKYGLPQDWNDDGKYGPERYIEAHIWSDDVIGRYLSGI